jgi:hypothetical protein
MITSRKCWTETLSSLRDFKLWWDVSPAINGWAIFGDSNPGDVVLDPFRGCGTTIDAAEKLGRQWIGIDIPQLAITLIKKRLRDTCGSRMKFASGTAAVSSPSPPRSGGEGRGEVAQIKSPHPASGHPLPAARGEGENISLVRIIGELINP